MRGKVYLVGAGPGDPELLTRKGYRLLQQAEVVVYDRLLSPRLLDLAPEGAERVYVGKAKSHHPVPQEEIHRILADRALAGKEVVRLKGGDPFVFGRGGEEALYLAERGIPFEIVPGVSSVLAVPAAAGIPLTQRGISSSFLVTTGHEDPEVPWEALAGCGTVVMVMGLSRLADNVARLIAGGRDPATPSALIAHGTTDRQRVVTAPLGDLPEAVARAAVEPPALLVVGEVVALAPQLSQWEEPVLPTATDESPTKKAP